MRDTFITRKKVGDFMKNRAKASVEWYKNNELNHETLPDFKKFMKKADKEFRSLNP